MRLSIEITPEQHQCLKAVAALQGKTIKAYVLERAFTDITSSQEKALSELESLLASRIEEADQGKFSAKSINNMMRETLQETRD